MKELSLRILSEKESHTHYRGFYRFKQFEMIVSNNTKGNDEYELAKGDLTKDEWCDVIAKYYHGHYSIR